MSLAKFWYNINYHSALKLTPFQDHYGIPLPIHIPYLIRDSPVVAVDRMLQEKKDMIQVLCHQLYRAQHRMKQLVDKHEKEREF